MAGKFTSVAFLLVAAGLMTASLIAQAPHVQRESEELGNKTLIGQFTTEKKVDFKKVMAGERPFAADDKKLLDQAAQYYVFRVTWFSKYQSDLNEMNTLRAQFKNEMEEAAKYREGPRDQLARNLVSCFKDVFKLKFENNRLGCVNAAIMLADLAQIKSETVGDFLADLVKDEKKHDAIRFYAARALGEVFHHIPPMQQTVIKTDLMRKEKDTQRINALVSFVERKWDPKQVDATVHYLRKEAVKALAQAQIPAVEVDGNKQQVTGPVVYGLLRVLRNQPALQPAPSRAERLEAAIGICQLKIDPAINYLPEPGIHQVGIFLIDFVKAYDGDRSKAQNKAGRFPEMPWKFQAERLKQALKDLIVNTAVNDDANARSKSLEKAARGLLDTISNQKAIEGLVDLVSAVNRLQPKGPGVFGTIKEAPTGD